MKRKDLEAFFAKNIAKPLTYDIHPEGEDRKCYSIEPTAVCEGSLLATVMLKSEEGAYASRAKPGPCGYIEVPMEDGDTIERVLLLAVVGAAYRSREVPYVRASNPCLLQNAELELQRRNSPGIVALR